MAQGFSQTRLDRIPHFLQSQYVDAGLLPHAAIMVSRGGEVVLNSVIGEARPGSALQQDAIYRIASMTKSITSIVFMMLVEEGKVTLDDPLTKFCPEFAQTGIFVAGGGNIPFVTRPVECPIRMRDLLTHTAGLTYGFQERHPVDAAYRKLRIDDFISEQSMDEFIQKLAAVPLLFNPGDHWNYSIATDVLGAVIARIEGKDLGVVLKERLFDPLGMKDTGFRVAPDQQHRLTEAYAFHPHKKMVSFDTGEDSRWAREAIEREGAFQSGGGGLLSTTADYHRFCLMLLGGGTLNGKQIISRKTLELMTANHLKGGGDLTEHSVGVFSEDENAGIGFGLGFATTIDPARSGVPCSAGDFYWGGMFSTGFFVDPVEDIAMLFMTQLMPSSTYPVRREIKTMIYAALND